MINFKKRLNKPFADKPVDPQELYSKLDRASDAGPLRPAQLAVVDEWHKVYRGKQDVIIKLHTGQGKTLVGLLLLQSKLNEQEGPAIYLCPNNHLVNQTIAQARKFGVQCVTIDKEVKDLPDAFLEGKSIFITTASKLFNGKTKFGLGMQSLPVSYLLMDDAHSCIETIKDSFTIELKNEHPAYAELVNLFSNDLASQGAGTFADIKRNEFEALLPVPYWSWADKQSEIINILVKHVKSNEIAFAWPLIKDSLLECGCIVSGKSLQISPYCPSLEIFGSYANAKHRIFMSATVTDDAFLIKGLGLSEDTVNHPLVYQKETWSGEKMVLIPSLIDERLTSALIANEFGKPYPARKLGIVALCPSFESTKIWEAVGSNVTKKSDIEDDVERLKSGFYERTLAIANRYDGIDLPDDSCRIEPVSI
jgi:replicative superfamily II helicase